jgi:hypothetical protein
MEGSVRGIIFNALPAIFLEGLREARIAGLLAEI